MIRNKTCSILAATMLATGAMVFASAPSANAVALVPNSLAVFSGTATFADGCSTGYVCVSAVSNNCANSQSVLNVEISLTGCTAELTGGQYKKVSSNGQEFCAGTGSGTFTFTDYFGRTLPPVTVTLVASEGQIHITGSRTDVSGTKTEAVDATIDAACGNSAQWAGTFTSYNE